MKRFVSIPILLALMLGGCTSGIPDGAESAPDGMPSVEVEFLLGTDAELSASVRSDAAARTFVPDGSLLPRREPPRTVLNSNDWQQVNDVRVYFFRRNASGDYVYVKPLDAQGRPLDCLSAEEFTLKFGISPYVVWWGGEENADEAHAWVGRVRLDPGEYRFLAIARDDQHVSGVRSLADPNVAVADWEWAGWTAGTTRLEDATLACVRTSPLAATELFCGSTSDPVRVDGSRTAFRCAIGLERAVAGILLYVEHIPATIRACVHDALGTHHTADVPVTGLAVVRGGRLSDRVRLWDRSAVAGTLTAVSAQTAAPDCPNPPLPAYSLLEVAIPDHAEVRDGIYTNLTPGNTAHPDALLQGGFVLPQAEPEEAGSDSGEHYDRSLYLVFLGEEGSGGRRIALEWRPIRLATDDSACDPLRFPLLANHFYSIGRRAFSADGTRLDAADDLPIDLRSEGGAQITIRIDPFWNEYYGGAIGNPSHGVNVDPEWGEHPGGSLQ